jgi:hypothetical protein
MVVGDTGFEPVTSTVCKRHKFWAQFGHSSKMQNFRLIVLQKNMKIAKKHLNELNTLTAF